MSINVDILSDDELRLQLREHGMEDVGPIIDDETRELYKRYLKKRLRESSTDRTRPSSVNKRRRVEESPVPPYKASYRKRGRSHSGYRPHVPMSASDNGRSSFVPFQMHTPKLAAEQALSDADTDGGLRMRIGMSQSGIRMSQSGIGMSQSGIGMNQSCIDDDVDYPYEMKPESSMELGMRPESSMELGMRPQSSMEPGKRFNFVHKPICRQSSGSDRWLRASLSSTARFIGEGVKSLVSSFLTPPVVHERNPPRDYRPQDSVDMGRELETELVTSNEVEVSLEPSAPPFPLEETTTHYDWELLPSDVEICIRPDGSKWRLGKGGFGEVFKGIKDGIDEVAVKVIKLQHHPSTEQFKSEIDMISKLRHRHILQFYGACIKPQCLYMVTELMQCDLFTALRTDNHYKWSGVYGKEVCVGIATGIHYLHSRRPPIVHRDIKSPNILLMDGLAKIADVGIARSKMDSDMTAQRGFTIAWAAPEVIYRRRATEKIDIWSFGIILWEVVTGRPPGTGRLVMPETAPLELRAMYSHCTSEDPTERPIAGDLLVSLKNLQ